MPFSASHDRITNKPGQSIKSPSVQAHLESWARAVPILNWRVKGLIQKGLSVTPGGVRINTHLQHVLGGRRDFDSHLADKIYDWSLSIGYLNRVNFQIRGARIMEIGTGWHPSLPICFALAGAGSIATFDLTRLLDEALTFRLLDSLEKHVPQIADLAKDSEAAIHARLNELRRSRDLNELLRSCNIDYFAPTDARASGVESNSIDLVYSNSVLEHVPREVIAGLMTESFRVLRPLGLAMHNVGCNDHYAFFDKSISFVNFLRYTEREWKLWNNSIQYQNRLRVPEYLDLAKAAGLDVIMTATNVSAGTLEALAGLRVAPQFRHFSEEDVAATTLDFIGQKPLG